MENACQANIDLKKLKKSIGDIIKWAQEDIEEGSTQEAYWTLERIIELTYKAMNDLGMPGTERKKAVIPPVSVKSNYNSQRLDEIPDFISEAVLRLKATKDLSEIEIYAKMGWNAAAEGSWQELRRCLTAMDLHYVGLMHRTCAELYGLSHNSKYLKNTRDKIVWRLLRY